MIPTSGCSLFARVGQDTNSSVRWWCAGIAAEPSIQLFRNTTNATTHEGILTMQVNLISPNAPATRGAGVVLNKTRTIVSQQRP